VISLAGGTVLERVLDQVLEHADQLVAVAAHEQRLGRQRDLDLDAAVVRERLQPVRDLPHDRREVDLVRR
jgi:hypothetical protein